MQNNLTTGALLACILAPAVGAQLHHATHVVAFDTNSDAGGGIFQPSNAVGAPSGGGLGVGSQHIHSLGIGGSLTLGFGVTITDGPGADFLVAENPFFQAGFDWHTFAEVAFVEVSTDGVTFVRFPARYYGPAIDPGPFGSVVVGAYSGLAGSTPVQTIASRDLVAAGGDAFDLADLASHPSVLSGAVDLQAIHQVRLVDVVNGVDVDDAGIVIRDAGAGSADIDAVTVVHWAGAIASDGPTVAIDVPVDGRFVISIQDPNGLVDIAAISTSIFGFELPAGAVLGGLTPTVVDPTHVTFELPGTLPASIDFQLAVVVHDFAGNVSGARRARPDGN